jgi:hypothetical protein
VAGAQFNRQQADCARKLIGDGRRREDLVALQRGPHHSTGACDRLLGGGSKTLRRSVTLQPEMNAELYYVPKLLQVGEFKEAFERAVAAVLGPDAQITVQHPRHTGRAGVRGEYVGLDAESLRAVVDLKKIDLFLTAKLIRAAPSASKLVLLWCKTAGGVLWMSADGEESVECLERVALNLGLEQTEAPKFDHEVKIEKLESRVLALEKAAKDVARTLRCFISFKFDDTQTITQVDRLKRLLAAVHIEWVTGEQFEPRRIEDKVKGRLRADVDFIIAVISKAGESIWIRDEIADANARGLWVVLLLENGATFDKGIFGTLEHIQYGLAIDQTFLALLEGINFIKAEVFTRASQNAASA